MSSTGDRPVVLIIEDESSLSDPLTRGLEEEGYVVDVASDGRTGLMKALAANYDVLIVDRRLPGIDGKTVVERLRAGRSTVPVIMLTAMRDIDHRVSGLDAGADDYLTKPFSFEELLARLRALRRRKTEASDGTEANAALIEVGSLRLDVPRRKAWHGVREVELRSKEYHLLELLARRAGEVVSRTVIAERVWGSPFEVTDNAIDVTVSNLRNHLSAAADFAGTVTIETVRGVGYRLVSTTA